MIEIILALLLAACPGCKHNGHFHNHHPNQGQVTMMSDDDTDDGGGGTGGETGHIPPPPPPPPPPPRP